MPLGVLNLPWLVHNSQRAYPLTEWATKQDESGTIKLPDSFLVSLYFDLPTAAALNPSKVFLRSLLISGSGYNLALAYDDASDSPPLIASVNIARSTHAENTTYSLPGRDDFADCTGLITIGVLDDIDRLPPGQYFFSPAGGTLEADCIRPMIRGVTSITVVNGSDRSPKLYGDIEFVADENMRLTPEIIEGENSRVYFSAIDGEGLNANCECGENELGPPIRTIDGIGPDPSGNFTLAGNECVNIRPITNGLQIEDTCSKPCCGCEALDAIRQQIDRFGDAYATFQSLVTRMGAEVTNMSMVVLGSRLGDQPCLEC